MSNAFSEAVQQKVAFSTVDTALTTKSTTLTEFTQECLVVQFSFSAMQDHTQALVVPTETLSEIAYISTGASPQKVDEGVIPEVRPAIEAIIQGICLAAGSLKNETVAASDLQLRFQILTLPANFKDDFAQVKVNVDGDGWSGSFDWIVDIETIVFLLDIDSDSIGHQTIQFPQVQDGGLSRTPEEINGLDRLLDIPLEISVELGRMKMLVKDVVELGAGSIVEIEKSAGEPVDILVNGRLVARGEVVVIEDNFGVRITEILSQQDRLNRLSEVA